MDGGRWGFEAIDLDLIEAGYMMGSAAYLPSGGDLCFVGNTTGLKVRVKGIGMHVKHDYGTDIG